MGEVWVGRDVRLEREIAVKFIRFPDGNRDEELIKRFVRESRITARLEHPGVPAIYDVGTTTDGRPYLVMQRVRGISVSDLVAEHGPLPVGWAAAIAAQTCAVLSVAHQSSLVHRDLKPGNLMLTPDGTVKVLDFGLAVALDMAEGSQITRSGQTLGTPAYMAPEQVLATMSSPLSDLYALGCTLYEMLSGEQVFTGSTAYAVMHEQVSKRPRSVRDVRSDVPGELARLVAQLLEKDPEARPEGANAVYDRLLPFVTGLTPLAGVLNPPAIPSQVRMYARVLGQVFAHSSDTPTTTDVIPEQPVRTQVSQDQLRQARRKAGELAREARHSQAAEILASVVEPASRSLDHHDPDLLAARQDLANLLFEGGDVRGAAPVYEGLASDLARRESGNPSSAFHCRFRAATCHALLGDTSLALRQLHALLEDEERVYGPEDFRPLEIRRQIGLLQLGTQEPDRAAATLTDLLTDLTRLHGPDHPQTRRVRDLLDGLDGSA
ncbi:serine/threonine protein kinase [Amycolatopsis rhizosphaerae]|uniref:non-specific serine/threonine protein kinase n=2 Tax=Amycolatopsis rhizosphaerae TaxID=2053003 RepID=A0A558D5S2_9PSEU|nr:serine/threonine protein kinase [Amycolatopsis rhizosphaerae]